MEINIHKIGIIIMMILSCVACVNQNDFVFSGATDEINSQSAKNSSCEYSAAIDSICIGEYVVESDSDLMEALERTNNEYLKDLRNQGYVMLEEESEDFETFPMSRASSFRIDTLWITDCVAMSEIVYFKAKFGKEMVDKINKVADVPGYQISTGTNYVCLWEIMGTFYNIKGDESVAHIASPLAGLHPDTKSDYFTRDYKIYSFERSDGSVQKQMNTYRLHICYKDTSKPTTRLDIYWPAEILDYPNYRGYQIIYAVRSR